VLTTVLDCVKLCFMKQAVVWRSIRFPVVLAREIEIIAKREKRSFSSQALLFIENELAKEKAFNRGDRAEGDEQA